MILLPIYCFNSQGKDIVKYDKAPDDKQQFFRA
jgi:hypothetical protein